MGSVAKADSQDKTNKVLRGLKLEFSEEQLTSEAGLAFVARKANELGVPKMLESVRLKRRAVGVSSTAANLSIIYNLCAGRGALSDLDLLCADKAAITATGLTEAVNSRRASEHLARFEEKHIEQLYAVARDTGAKVAATLLPKLAQEQGYIPVFVDGTGIEVQGKHFEKAAVGYNGERQYWLHTVFVGDTWLSARLHPGATDVAASWHEQLENDIAPLLSAYADSSGTATVKPWVRMDNAYYRKDVVAYLKNKGWDFSISLTNDRNKAPVLEKAKHGLGLNWRHIGPDENATIVYYQPSKWESVQRYVVIETQYEGAQKLIETRHQVIAVSDVNLPIEQIIKRHRQKQGQENALKGPLNEMDLHHPPSRGFVANQAFYALGQIAQLLLMALKYQALPEAAKHFGVGRIIKYFVQLAGKITHSARQVKLWLSKGHPHLDWLNHCANRLRFG